MAQFWIEQYVDQSAPLVIFFLRELDVDTKEKLRVLLFLDRAGRR